MNASREQYLEELQQYVRACCESWAGALRPRTPIRDFDKRSSAALRKEEVHTCSRCNRSWIVEFLAHDEVVWPQNLIAEGSQDEPGSWASVRLRLEHIAPIPPPILPPNPERDRAVQLLCARGLFASARDWILGQTVFVGVSPIDELDGVCVGAVHLLPSTNDRKWELQVYGLWGLGDLEFESLEAAVDGTCVYVKRMEQLHAELLDGALDLDELYRRFFDDVKRIGR